AYHDLVGYFKLTQHACRQEKLLHESEVCSVATVALSDIESVNDCIRRRNSGIVISLLDIKSMFVKETYELYGSTRFLLHTYGFSPPSALELGPLERPMEAIRNTNLTRMIEDATLWVWFVCSVGRRDTSTVCHERSLVKR
ncbi:unnamed protein product, partial [Protopolystoma xenopodis]